LAAISNSPQFENVILKNRPSVWKKLGISAEDIIFDNPYWQTATQKTRGCQIDYMIQCRNNTVYACEIKFSKNPLQRAVISEVDRKICNIAKPRNYTSGPSSSTSTVSTTASLMSVISTP
jgi:hypothetical protein